MGFSEGDLVYVPFKPGSEENGANIESAAFLPGTVQRIVREDEVDVKIVGKVHADQIYTVTSSDLRARFKRDDEATSQDNTALVHMNDATILENLHLRHQKDEIYTYTASVLLAVNPYKDIDGLYGDAQCELYKGKHIGALPPHPYAIADTAYRALMRDQKNQGLLISGESGAGKTETAKIVMAYFSYVSGASSDLAARIQERVKQAQPILESFGNAVTMRNSNSSRFGKYNKVFFNETGTLVDAGITTYLLEASRVVVHSEMERTYHCFYEMLGALNDADLQRFGLERNRRYTLLHASGNTTTHATLGDRDRKNFNRLTQALSVVGFDASTTDQILQVLAGLIHLGDNLAQAPDEAANEEEDGKTVELNEAAVEQAAELLGFDSDDLAATLKRKKVAVPGRSSFHEVPRTGTAARHALHSLIKALYKRLFERMVQRINSSFKELQPDGTSRNDDNECRHIGILDIYGFERLQRNSFEQLCINLANERLQQYFVENVLRAEQCLYEREGLPWIDLALPDSQPVVNCIGAIFKTLDEYSQQLAKGFESASDAKFCEKVLEEAGKDAQRKEVLKKMKMNNTRRSSACPAMNEAFVVKHYAGEVTYTTQGWLDKNNDRLLLEAEALICNSTNTFVQSLADTDQGGKVLFRSISKKYSTDLEALLKTLSTCNLHYIRCFKPNEVQKPNLFRDPLVLDQIIQCGTIELVKIMHDGYPNRCPFEEMTNRFRDLLPEKFAHMGMRTFIEVLMLAYEVPQQEWALGMSRLFLKAGQLKSLEDMRSGGVKPDPETLARIASAIIRKRWRRAGNAVKLCLYIPKFIMQMRVKQTQQALCRASILTARFSKRLEIVRKRIAERRLAVRRRLTGVFFAVRLMSASWRTIKAARKERVTKALRLWAYLRIKMRPWVAGARERAAEAEKRKEAERRREEERRRIAEEKRLAEEERQRAAAQELEEERKRLEEERLQQEAALAAERQEEERRREEQKLEEAKKLDEERQRFEEEKRAWQEQMQQQMQQDQERRLSVLAAATPARKTSLQGGLEAANATGSAACSTVDGEIQDDDITIGDSASVIANSTFSMTQPQMQALVQQEMDKRIKDLELHMFKQQEEVMQKMKELQFKNDNLEKQLANERLQQTSPGYFQGADAGAGTPARWPLQESPASLVRTPPDGSATRNKRVARQSYSLLQADQGRRASTKAFGNETSRSSVACPEPPASGSRRKTKGTADKLAGKQWNQEMRNILLEDLGYCDNRFAPVAPSPAASSRKQEANSAEQQSRENMKNALRARGGRCSTTQEVRDLSGQLEAEAGEASPTASMKSARKGNGAPQSGYCWGRRHSQATQS